MPTPGLFSGMRSPSPASSPHSRSNGTHNRLSDSSALSPGSNFTCRTSSTGSIRVTSSDTSIPGQWTAATGPPWIKCAPAKNQSHNEVSAKSKLFNMLSAVDRKRKQAVSPIKAKDVHSAQAASPDGLTPTRTFSTAFRFAKMQPRGATEREDYSGLRTFLYSNPAKPEDKAQTHVPKSRFDWDDSSDGGSSPQARKSAPRSLQRVTRRWQAAGGNKLRLSDGMFGTGLSVDAWMENAQKYAEGLRRQAQATNGTENNQDVSGEFENCSSTGYGCGPIRRKSVLKLFDDPFWSNCDDITQAVVAGTSADKETKSIDQDAVAGRPRGSTVERSRSGSAKTGASSLFPKSPTKGEVKVDWFFGPGLLPNALHQTNGNRYGRDVLPFDVPERTPSTAWTLDAKDLEGLPEKRLYPKPSKTSMIKRLKSQFFEATGVPKSIDSDPQDVHDSLRFTGSPRSLEKRVRRFNNDTDSPKRDHKRLIDAKGISAYSTLAAVTEPRGYKRDPKWSPPSCSSSTSAGTETLPLKGYPKGPDDPNWDDAVKHVKKIVQERERREAEEARQQQKEFKNQEKKLKRLKAGKDVVIRGSQLGLIPKKPIDEMTEDEFETVGAIATTPAKDTSIVKKSGIFGTLFTKILGTTQEKQQHVESIKMKLERHKSLELLNMASVGDVKELSVENRTHYEKALRALGGESSPFTLTPEIDDRNSTSDDKDRKTANTQKGNGAEPSDGATDSGGLGITATTRGPAVERHKLAKDMSYQEFVALKRRRQNLNSEGETTECIHNGLVLPDIAEEDAESGIDRGIRAAAKLKLEKQHEDDDGSSWCTESIYSIDEIEKMSGFGGSSVQYQDSSWQSAPQVGQRVGVECYSTSQFSESYAPSSFQNNNQDDDYDATSNYSDKIELDAMPAPLNIRILKVKQSSMHDQPAHANSFIPDRKASFHARIQEVSRLQEAHIGSLSHPAFRTGIEDERDVKSAEHPSDVQYCDDSIDTKPEHDSLDSGISSMSGVQFVQADEGYASGNMKQHEFLRNENPASPSSELSRSTFAQHCEGGSPTGESGDPVDDVDLGALRTEVGLGQLRLASSTSSPRHPHHPFTWSHEKVMCRQIHNPMEALPSMPVLPCGATVSVSRMDSDYFNSRPMKSATDGPNMCQSCGSLCCRFANLLVTSQINTGGDITEEMVRTKAQQRVNMLRTYHPNGIEEYETFIQCAQCRQQVCPNCAKRCCEQLCQSIVCIDCRAQSEICPVHQGI